MRTGVVVAVVAAGVVALGGVVAFVVTRRPRVASATSVAGAAAPVQVLPSESVRVQQSAAPKNSGGSDPWAVALGFANALPGLVAAGESVADRLGH